MFKQDSQAGKFKLPFFLKLRQAFTRHFQRIISEFSCHWIEVALIISFVGSIDKNGVQLFGSSPGAEIMSLLPASEAMNTSLLETGQSGDDGANWGNTYSNLVYTEGDFATNDKERARAIKRLKQRQYIEKYVAIAQEEMQEHGIPASITLAQGLLESNVGESKLATKNNNHFGLKCFSKTCKRGHCSNFEDDSHKDFFRKFDTPESSYAAHSKLLQKPRYRNLFNLEVTDYQAWAHGLKKAGYATDPKYGYKLINLIKSLNLDQYDQLPETVSKEVAAD